MTQNIKNWKNRGIRDTGVTLGDSRRIRELGYSSGKNKGIIEEKSLS